MTENIYAAPRSKVIDSSKPFELCADGRFVVTKRDTHWGDCCYRCNESAREIIKVKLTYEPKLPMLAFIIFLLGGGLLDGVGFVKANIDILTPLWAFSCFFLLLLTALMSKRIKLDLPICSRHRRLTRRLAVISWLLVVIFLVVLVVVTVWAIFPLILLIVSVVVRAVIDPRLTISKKQDDLFWVKGVSEEFRESLPKFR